MKGLTVFLAGLTSNAPKVPILSNKTVRTNLNTNRRLIQVAACCIVRLLQRGAQNAPTLYRII